MLRNLIGWKMGNRIGLLVSVVFAGIALATTSAGAAPADDECLAKPKGAAPAGKHWYYNTDRAKQRKCWYLADEGQKVYASAPRKQSPPAASVDSNKESSEQPPAADARAELVDEPKAGQPAAEQPAMPAIQAQPEAPQAAAPQAAPADDASKHSWTVASRWPERPDAFASSRAVPLNESAPVLAQVEAPAPVLAAAPAQQSSVEVATPDAMSFEPLAAALILFVAVGGAIFMFISLRRRTQRSSIAPGRVTHNFKPGYEMPWTGASTRRPATRVNASERGSLSDEIEEVEQLLAIARRRAS
jgi:hypothetical protein